MIEEIKKYLNDELQRIDNNRKQLEEIEKMLNYRNNVRAEVYTKKERFEGIVTECNEEGITLKIDNHKILISLIDIESINILKL